MAFSPLLCATHALGATFASYRMRAVSGVKSRMQMD